VRFQADTHETSFHGVPGEHARQGEQAAPRQRRVELARRFIRIDEVHALHFAGPQHCITNLPGKSVAFLVDIYIYGRPGRR
jgi:hypothetical protein